MIGDFDGSANALWTLFGTEAKSHDEAQINSLKYGMDGVLIFVRSTPTFLCLSSTLVVLILGLTGWFILRRPHSICSRQQRKFTSQPHRSNGILPPTTLVHPLSDFPATFFHCPRGLHPFRSAATLPCI